MGDDKVKSVCPNCQRMLTVPKSQSNAIGTCVHCRARVILRVWSNSPKQLEDMPSEQEPKIAAEPEKSRNNWESLISGAFIVIWTILAVVIYRSVPGSGIVNVLWCIFLGFFFALFVSLALIIVSIPVVLLLAFFLSKSKKDENSNQNGLLFVCGACGTRYALGENSIVVSMDEALAELGIGSSDIGRRVRSVPDAINLKAGRDTWPEGKPIPICGAPSDTSIKIIVDSRKEGRARSWRCEKCETVQFYPW